MQLRNMILVLALVMAAATPAFAVTLEYITSPSTTLGGWDLTYDGSLAVVNFGGQVYLMDPDLNFTLVQTVPPGPQVQRASPRMGMSSSRTPQTTRAWVSRSFSGKLTVGYPKLSLRSMAIAITASLRPTTSMVREPG